MTMIYMDDLKQKAILLGASDFGKSSRRNKRYYVIYNNNVIHFGSANGMTYFDHRDTRKQKAWRSRHEKVQNSQGDYVYKLKTSPAFWAYNLLW